MSDDLDRMIQGENQGTPSVSQTETEQPGSNPDDLEGGQGGQAEEVEFNRLGGDAQDRFRKIYREKQDMLAENDKLKRLLTMQQGNGLGVPPSPLDNPAIKEAKAKLDAAGIATKEFVESQIQSYLAQKTFYDELDKMENTLDGSDGRPKFTREEYQDYIQRHPEKKNYLPMDVYKSMYEEELYDWRATNKNGRPSKTQTLRPTRTVSRESKMTPEDIENKLKSLPESQRSQWLSAHEKEVNEALSNQG